MDLHSFNQLSPIEAKNELLRCCGSERWASSLMDFFPFSSFEELLDLSDRIWKEDCGKADYLEAFGHHRKIGDIKSLEKKFADTKSWAEREQSGVSAAANEVLEKLAKGNEAYETKFGYIFIICASGKSAEFMLEHLLSRLKNDLETEISIASEEQNKITIIRLEKLFL